MWKNASAMLLASHIYKTSVILFVCILCGDLWAILVFLCSSNLDKWSGNMLLSYWVLFLKINFNGDGFDYTLGAYFIITYFGRNIGQGDVHLPICFAQCSGFPLCSVLVVNSDTSVLRWFYVGSLNAGGCILLVSSSEGVTSRVILGH